MPSPHGGVCFSAVVFVSPVGAGQLLNLFMHYWELMLSSYYSAQSLSLHRHSTQLNTFKLCAVKTQNFKRCKTCSRTVLFLVPSQRSDGTQFCFPIWRSCIYASWWSLQLGVSGSRCCSMVFGLVTWSLSMMESRQLWAGGSCACCSLQASDHLLFTPHRSAPRGRCCWDRWPPGSWALNEAHPF